MQMPNQDKNNNKKRKWLRKSQLLLIGSFLVFIGLFVLSYNHLAFLKEQVFSNMKIAIAGLNLPSDEEEEIDVPVADNVSDGTVISNLLKRLIIVNMLGYLKSPK